MENRIMSYTTVSCETPRDLDKEVSKKIHEGWQPVHPPYSHTETIYAKELDTLVVRTYCNQPMVRYEKTKRGKNVRNCT